MQKSTVISKLFTDKLSTWVQNTYNSCEGCYHPSLAYDTVQDLELILYSGTSEYARKALLKYMKTIQHSGCIN